MKTIFMPTQMKEAWVTALRSGMYKQGKGGLRTRNGEYCCLGVLQMVVSGKVEKEVGLPTEKWLESNGILFHRRDGNSERNPYLSLLDTYASTANDTGCSFEQIASAIENAWQAPNSEEVKRPE